MRRPSEGLISPAQVHPRPGIASGGGGREGRVEQRTAGGLQPFVTSFCSRLGFYFMNLLPPSRWVESSSPWLRLVPLLRLCAWQESFRKREGPRRRLTHPARRPTHTVREVSGAASPVPFPGTT